MPRVILRTVEPAKLLACQSVENRCTLWKPLFVTSAMVRSVSRMMPLKMNQRRATLVRPRATTMTKARSARSAALLPAMASTIWPEKTGTMTSARVLDITNTMIPPTKTGRWRQ